MLVAVARALGDVMSTDLLLAVPEETLGEAAEKMRAHGVGAVLVMDAGRLLGILTERDLLNAVASRIDPSEAQVREWMTERPITASREMPIPQAANIMVTRRVRHLPIVDGERTIGIVSLHDVVRATARLYPEYEGDED